MPWNWPNRRRCDCPALASESGSAPKPTGAVRPKVEVHGVICPHLIEYSVIPASPQSAAAAGLNVFSDIRNCLGR